MSAAQQKIRNQQKAARLEIVAKLHKKGYSMRAIQSEVMKTLELTSYSLRTVHNDIQSLLAEWRKYRLENTDDLVQLQLERIDDLIREAWEQWEKSKTNYTKTAKKKKGRPAAIVQPLRGSANQKQTDNVSEMKTYQREETTTEVIMLGDVSYISEIRHLWAERCKLLGLYAPEKRDITGDLSFTALLMESGIINGESEGHTQK